MAAPLLTLANELPITRVQRRPRHDFNISFRPFQIQPFCIAPVLPGESLESVHMQAREVSSPAKNPLIGWSSEFYLFYVKIRDLNDRDTLDDLFINPTASVSSLNVAAAVETYHAGGSPDFTALCLRRVTETYFRDEGETWNTNLIGNLPAAQIMTQRWMDSLVDTTVLSAGSGDPGATTTPEALDKMMDAYEYLRAMNLTSMNFEDYLATFGVHISKSEMHKPELIWRKKDFKYPVNTIDPTSGAPSSALSWTFQEDSRDKKYFKEPGFLFGVTVVRPKLYFSKQKGSLTHFLDQGLSWLPAIMRDSPETSLREFVGGGSGVGPLATNTTNGYWVDMRDLFLYGDQFFNYADTAADKHLIDLPTAALVRKYPTAAMVDEFFAAASPANVINCDGMIQYAVRGTQRDMTDGVQAEGR